MNLVKISLKKGKLGTFLDPFPWFSVRSAHERGKVPAGGIFLRGGAPLRNGVTDL